MPSPKTYLAVVTLALGASLPSAKAQSCNDIHVKISPEPRGRLQLVQDISRYLQMSVLAELPYQENADAVIPIPGESDVSAYAKRLSSDGMLRCVVDEGVIHIYDPKDLASGENALNYIFDNFTVPSTAELFGVVFRNRLLTEANRSKSLGLVSGSEGGGTSNNAEKFPLKPERLRDTSAREILFRTFRQVPMVFAVEIHKQDSSGPAAAWVLSSKNMVLAIIPSRLP